MALYLFYPSTYTYDSRQHVSDADVEVWTDHYNELMFFAV